MPRDWRGDEEAIDEAREDRYLDEPEQDYRPLDELSREERDELVRERRRRR